MKTVTIIQRVLPHYRLSFFKMLAERLSQSGIALHLIYGQEYPGTVPKTTPVDAGWATKITNSYMRLPWLELVWQPCIARLQGADLVIFEQSNRLLINYLLIFRLVARQSKLAYWGHGKNMQAGRWQIIQEMLKRSLVSKVDWWFAYTQKGADLVAGAGFPREKVTAVQNTIDTGEFKRQLSENSPEMLGRIRADLNIQTDQVCLYCGGMYADKKLDFLLHACHGIKKNLPDFQMIFIGSGPEQHKVSRAAADNSWIHYLGPKFGADVVPYFMISKALLMPGLVGLAIVDSFVAQVPLFTTDLPIHSPEIEYLINGVNGIMVPCSLDDYVAAVVGYLKSDSLQSTLREGCAASARKYSLDNMVNNYVSGIKSCLAS